MRLARVHDLAAQRAPGPQHPLAGRHDRLQQRHVVAQAGAEAAGLDEVALHVDDDQDGRRRVEGIREGSGRQGDHATLAGALSDEAIRAGRCVAGRGPQGFTANHHKRRCGEAGNRHQVHQRVMTELGIDVRRDRIRARCAGAVAHGAHGDGASRLTCAATTRQPSGVRIQVWLWRPERSLPERRNSTLAVAKSRP